MTLIGAEGPGTSVVLRWGARIVGLVAAALLLVLVIDWGPQILLSLPWDRPTGMPLLIALVLSVVGVIVAWRWETIGGAMALTASLAAILLVFLGSGTAKLLVAFVLILPPLLAGALHLACSGCMVASSLLSGRASR